MQLRYLRHQQRTDIDSMNDYLRGFLIVVCLLAAGGGVWWWFHRGEPAPLAAAVETPATAPPDASPSATPPQHHPIEEAQPQPDSPPAGTTAEPPTLDNSDALIDEALSTAMGRSLFEALFVKTGLIRRIVVTIDNLPRDKIAYRQLPVQPASGKLQVTNGAQPQLMPDNAQRYSAYVRLADSIDAKTLVGAYVRLYPLFQQAYRELGYPDGYFNDRLIVAIDDLLAAPDVPEPALAQPSVWYVYADPQLEALSIGRKTMIRIGPDNELRIKAKLQEIRARLVAGAPQG